MNHLKENQKIKIIPDNIEEFSMGIIVSVSKDCFVAEVNNPSLIKTGIESEILISAANHMVLFNSKVNKIEHNHVFFALPSKYTVVQKREYPRINTKMPVFLKEKDNSKEIEAETVNIGGGGMQVASQVKSDLKCILNARFTIPNKKEINTSFEILRMDKESEKIFFSGKFNNISNFDKTAIIQFCFKRQLELKCKKQTRMEE